MRQYVGVDLGAERCVAARCLEGRKEAERAVVAFATDRPGFEKLLDFIRQRPEPAVLVMESTGSYWVPLYVFLREQGLEVAVINPVRTKHFAKSRLERTKNDRVDARLLAAYGAREAVRAGENHLEGRAFLTGARILAALVKERGSHLQLLRELLRLLFPEAPQLLRDLDGPLARKVLRLAPSARAARQRGDKTLARVRVQGACLGPEKAHQLVELARTSLALPGEHPSLERTLLALLDTLDVLEHSIDAIASQLRRLAPQADLELLTSIPGVGEKIALVLLAEVRNPGRFRRGDNLVGYVGLYPEERASGNKGSPETAWRMSQAGNHALRRVLFLSTLSAVVRNPRLAAYYQKKLAEGKSKMNALGHCMKKQLLLIRAVWISRRPYDPAYGALAA